MKASLLTIGDEILIGQIINSNTAWMSEQLTSLGIDVVNQLTVGDHEAEIVGALEFINPRSDIVIIGGGLGPTHDDVTIAALAHYFDLPLVYDPEWIAQVEAFFKARNRPMTENNKKQGHLLEGAIRIDNDCGTAAGQHFIMGDTEFFVVPGVPHEMKSMMNRYILPKLKEKNPDQRILKQTLLTSGVGESMLATRCEAFVQKVKSRDEVSLAFLPSTTQVKVRLQMEAHSGANDAEFESLVEELKALCGKDFFGLEPDSMEEMLVRELTHSSRTLALAESCTGGLIAHRITQVPGASKVLKGALVAYQNSVKESDLSIPKSLLENGGAVSEATAKSMAEAIRKKWNSDFGLATTGYLGPAGGDAQSPVGTVWIALATREQTQSRVFSFENNRERSKERAAQAALDLLRRSL
ncbi:MAG: competence/damage-inducible protein A [Bdellovibrionales bacterium]|nr:competence/damage-inducible protein A [Oligoflexia bacterium]